MKRRLQHRWRRHAAAACATALLGAGTPAAHALEPRPADRFGPDPGAELVNGDLVSEAEQRQLGLVAVGGGCSGTLLNRFWVITADHCVARDGNMGGPAQDLALLGVEATWSPRNVLPTKVVRYHRSHDRDIALLFLGAGDLGEVPVQKLLPNSPAQFTGTGIAVRAYGRGIHALAKVEADGSVTPAQRDGQYRTARFVPYFWSNALYHLRPNSRDQMMMSGDSGSSEVALSSDGKSLGIVGIHSRSRKEFARGMPREWRWTTKVTRATADAVHDVRADIERVTREGFVPCPDTASACSVLEASALTVMLQ